MKRTTLRYPAHLWAVLGWVFVFCLVPGAFGGQSEWQRDEVDWRGPAGSRIKAIRHAREQQAPTFQNRGVRRPANLEARGIVPQVDTTLAAAVALPGILTYVIDSPPINGFVPWVAVGITDARSYEWMDYIAYEETAVTGNYLTASPQADYALGIFDTGASAHVMSVYDAATTGIYDAGLVTSATVELAGATGNVIAFVSQPLGVFLDGLQAIDAGTLEVDDSNMVGQSNVSIIVGDIVESPNIPTVVGCPLAIFFTTVIRNEQLTTLEFDGNEIVAPEIRVYPHDDARIPSYPNKINLELRPTDGSSVGYFPCVEIEEGDCPDGDGSPLYPSTVWGFLPTQSLFFTSRVDLAHGIRTSQQKKFMFDTGAEITVISESQAAELELNPADPDFEVEIMGITGDFIVAPGFFIDRLEISASPQWVSYTHVPVIMLDVDSPEGGILEGIIGTNLFVDMNYYIRGGGLVGYDPPYIKFEFLPAGIVGDISPSGGDGKVDFLDLAALAEAWLANPMTPNWNSRADIVGDATINFRDFARLAESWRQTTAP